MSYRHGIDQALFGAEMNKETGKFTALCYLTSDVADARFLYSDNIYNSLEEAILRYKDIAETGLEKIISCEIETGLSKYSINDLIEYQEKKVETTVPPLIKRYLQQSHPDGVKIQSFRKDNSKYMAICYIIENENIYKLMLSTECAFDTPDQATDYLYQLVEKILKNN